MKVLILLLLLVTPCYAGVHELPSKALTPGSTNPDVTQATITNTICKTGWAATVRPKGWVVYNLKRKAMKAYSRSGTPKRYEADHLIPIELGGSIQDIKNIWPQPYSPRPNAHEKDWIENKLRREVCAGKLTLEQAQQEISTDWWAAYQKRKK